jgi:hypothetical protein
MGKVACRLQRSRFNKRTARPWRGQAVLLTDSESGSLERLRFGLRLQDDHVFGMGPVPHIHDLFGALAGVSQAIAGDAERTAGLVTKEFRRANGQNEILNRRI